MKILIYIGAVIIWLWSCQTANGWLVRDSPEERLRQRFDRYPNWHQIEFAQSQAN